MVLPLDLNKHENAPQWTQKRWLLGSYRHTCKQWRYRPFSSVQDMDFNVERKVMEVNFWAAAALTKAIANNA